MKPKETVNLYRLLSITSIILVTFGVTAFMCLGNHFYLDEWLCLFFLDLIFVCIYLFELEYERRSGKLSNNTKSNFIRLACIYTLCAALTYGASYLPEFCKPVILVPILMCAVSNSTMAIVVGIFFDILLSISAGGYSYALITLCLLTLLGGVLAEALKHKTYRLCLSFLILFLNILIPGIFYYLSYKEMDNRCFVYGAVNGIVSAFVAYFLFGRIWKETSQEVYNQYLDIVSEEYSEVKALKDFSMLEYRHAKKVSDVAFRCAKAVGCNENLCLAAGFYYRMGRWLGEPYTQNAMVKAESLCFPEALTQILYEYYGEEQALSTPESALVHMVDAIVKKLEVMHKDVGNSQWNRDMLIYQTLNEFSSTGLYDQSGMSMNQFLKAREFLAKEESLS